MGVFKKMQSEQQLKKFFKSSKTSKIHQTKRASNMPHRFPLQAPPIPMTESHLGTPIPMSTLMYYVYMCTLPSTTRILLIHLHLIPILGCNLQIH